MNSSDQAFVVKLTRSKIYREYEAAFRTAFALPLACTAVETWGLALHGDRNESPFCHLMAQANTTCAAELCLQSQLRHDAADRTATATDFSGICTSAVPVRLGARLVGFLHTGQVFLHPPAEADFQRTRQALAAQGVAVVEGSLRSAYFATGTMALPQYQAVLGLLQVFAEQLAAMSNQIFVTEKLAESPQIARAREYIGQRMADDIRVADGARIAHMSRFYFCKCFKRATGMPFTEYLARLRTERAKARLLEPHLRASEVAFEVGFQSLSQFNRVFKRMTGQCPTDYRHSGPQATVAGRPDGRASARHHATAHAETGTARSGRPLSAPG